MAVRPDAAHCIYETVRPRALPGYAVNFATRAERRYSHFMKVEVEKQPGSVSTLQIELPPEEVSKEWDAIANSFARFAKIPGYRPGKAPRAVIEKRFRKEIQDELTKKLVSKSNNEMIEQ